MDKQGRDSISWRSCVRLGACALAVFLLAHYWGGIENFLVLLLNGIAAILAGIVIAYVVNIPMRFFERKLPGQTGDGTLNRTLSMALAIICIVGVVLFVGLLVVPQLVDAVITLAKEAPGTVSAITESDVMRSFIPAQLVAQLESIDWSKVVNDAAAWLQSGVVSSLPQIVSLFGQIGAWFMGIVFAFWYLAEKNRLGSQCRRLVRNYLGTGADGKAMRVVALVDECFHNYIVGQSLEALIFGSLVAAGAALFGIPDALSLGALVGVMSLIPMVGALVGAILGAFMILAVSWQKAIVFLVVFFVVQQIESNFIYKRVVGKHVGLTGMWPLIGVTLGAALFGIAGAFVGVPVTAAIFRVLENDLTRRESLPDGSPTPLDKLHESLSD